MITRYFPHEYEDDVFTIDYDALYRIGIRGLIFDIDNTLVPHGKGSSEKVDALFGRLKAMGFTTLLLSNNGTQRIENFNANIGSLYIADAGKPATEGFNKALSMLAMDKEQTVVIGDQVFTDICGANRCGIANILVKYINHKKIEWKGWKRYLEWIVLRIYLCSNKHKHRLYRKTI